MIQNVMYFRITGLTSEQYMGITIYKCGGFSVDAIAPWEHEICWCGCQGRDGFQMRGIFRIVWWNLKDCKEQAVFEQSFEGDNRPKKWVSLKTRSEALAMRDSNKVIDSSWHKDHITDSLLTECLIICTSIFICILSKLTFFFNFFFLYLLLT